MPETDALTEPVEPIVEPVSPAPTETVSKADFDRIAGELETLKTAYTEAGKRLTVIDRVAEMLTGKSDSPLSDNDQAVVKELHRILPQLKHLDSLPKITQTVDAAARAAADALTQAAFGYQLELQQEAGLKVDDADANYMIGSAIKEWINADQGRRARFWRGDRTVVKDGFETVQNKLLGPARRQDKTATLQTVASRPRNSAPGGGSQGAGGETQTVDFKDPKAVRAAFKAALAG